MKFNFRKVGYYALLVSALSYSADVFAQERVINTINVKNTKELHDFFKYTGKDVPIVSGHRGGNEMGFPKIR